MFGRLKQHWISYKLRETPLAIVLRALRKKLNWLLRWLHFLVFTTCRPQSRQNKRYCNCNKGLKQSSYFMARKYMFIMNHICCSVNMYAEILLPCHYWNAVCYDVMYESVSRISYHDDVVLKKERQGAYTWSSPVCLSMCDGSEYTSLSVTTRNCRSVIY